MLFTSGRFAFCKARRGLRLSEIEPKRAAVVGNVTRNLGSDLSYESLANAILVNEPFPPSHPASQFVA